MALVFKPLSKDDYSERGKPVLDAFASSNADNSQSINSPLIFGDNFYREYEDRFIGTDHMRGYIPLIKPVINEVIAGNNASILARILGWENVRMKKLLNFEEIEVNGVPTTVSNASAEIDMRSVKMGPEIVRDFIETFDIEGALMQELHHIMRQYYDKHKMKHHAIDGTFVHTPTKCPIGGTWYYEPLSSDPCHYDDFISWIANEIYSTDSSRITYLLALAKNPEEGERRLRACILEDIMVVPIGMRPDIGRMHDQLSVAYADVIKENNSLGMLIRGFSSLDQCIVTYRNLTMRVHGLLVEHSKYNQNRKAIMERLKSKQGHVREKMLGKRIDYSGRSVITIDPFMSLRNIGIPKDMAPKLYRSAILRSYSNPNPADFIGPRTNRSCCERLESAHILDNVPVITGRQPTLHKLSIRAFEPVLTDERSIRINPLCVSGFNADFDGDQMWVRVPVSEGAQKEARDLMKIQQNMFWPKNGECSVMPRQEIIYGLNVCTREYPDKQAVERGSFADYTSLFDALFKQDVKVWDMVTFNGAHTTAGKAAFSACISSSVLQSLGVHEITSKSIQDYVNMMMQYRVEDAIDHIDLMVQLGFRIAAIYPPTLNLLDDNAPDYSSQMEKFHEAIEEDTQLYMMGWEEEDEYERAYAEAFDRLVDKEVKGRIYDDIGQESGFVRMAESGARGSKSNLLQMYGYKGRVQKNSHESFRAVIEHSYTDQLTPLEHFITAYGGRSGLIQKSLKSSDSGYAMRKMWHAASPFVITRTDCGTTNGIHISKAYLLTMFNKEEVSKIFVDIVTGRYVAGEANHRISHEEAVRISQQEDFDIKIRSPLTCEDPCCKYCYGNDLSTNSMAAAGLPIGFIAAHSIGEPGTQLNMDSFKKGGVAGSRSTGISGFEKLEAYTGCAPMNKRSSYDPIAWADGNVREKFTPDGQKEIFIEGSQMSKKLPADAKIKPIAKKGEGLCIQRGDYDINELVAYAGISAAQLYLIHALYSVYKDEGGVNMKHLEVLVASMTMHMVITTDRKDLVPGQWHDTIQLLQGDLSNTVYVSTLKSIKTVQPSRPYALCKLLMESFKSGISDIVLLGLEDPLTYPLNRIMMGLAPWYGTDWDKWGSGDNNFMEERRCR